MHLEYPVLLDGHLQEWYSEGSSIYSFYHYLANWIPASSSVLIFYCFVTNHHKLSLTGICHLRNPAGCVWVLFFSWNESGGWLAVFSSGFRVLFQIHSCDEQNSVSCVCRTWVHNPQLAISQGPLEHWEAAPIPHHVIASVFRPSAACRSLPVLWLFLSFATSLRILSTFKGLVWLD